MVWRFLSNAHRASEHGAAASALDQAARQHLLDVLTHVAVTFARDPRGWIDRMSHRDLAAAVKGAGDALADLGGSPGTVIERLAGKAGILVPVGNPADGEQDYVFLHRTLAEYLVARYLHELDTGLRMEIIAEHQWFDPDWAEVIPILGGLFGSQECEKASDLVRHFLAQRPDPLHYAFRTALRILGEVPEPDRLLTPEQKRDLAQRTSRLIATRATRDMLTRTLAEANASPRSVTEALLAMLHDDGWDLREAVVRALDGRGGDDVTRALLDRLHDDDQDVRRAAAETLAGRDGDDVTCGLLAVLHDDVRTVREAAVRALAGREGGQVTRGLLAVLHDLWVRDVAVRALAGREGGEVTRVLVDLLYSPYLDVREAAVEALTRRDNTTILSELTRQGIRRKLSLSQFELAIKLADRLYSRIPPKKGHRSDIG